MIGASVSSGQEGLVGVTRGAGTAQHLVRPAAKLDLADHLGAPAAYKRTRFVVCCAGSASLAVLRARRPSRRRGPRRSVSLRVYTRGFQGAEPLPTAGSTAS